MIRNIVFDIGNVLVDYDWQSYLKSYAFDAAKETDIANALFKNTDWKELDRGAIPLPELEELFVANAPQYREDILKVFRSADRCIRRRDYAIPWIQALKKRGFRVYYLSNYSESVRKATKDSLDFLPFTDGGLFSYEVKQVKPDAEIFHSLLARYPEIIPEETIFFDDTRANVNAACALGFHGVLFEDQGQAENAILQISEV